MGTSACWQSLPTENSYIPIDSSQFGSNKINDKVSNKKKLRLTSGYIRSIENCCISIYVPTDLQRIIQLFYGLDFTKYYNLNEKLIGCTRSIKAMEKITNKSFVVKIIHKNIKYNNKEKQRMEMEILSMKLIKHPNIIQLHSFFETKSVIYLIMPLYQGISIHILHI